MVQIIFRMPGPTSTWTALRWDLGILGKSIPEDHACAAAQDTEVQIYIIKLFAEIYIIYLYVYSFTYVCYSWPNSLVKLAALFKENPWEIFKIPRTENVC